MKRNFLSSDGFEKWLKNDQSDDQKNLIGKRVYPKIKFSELLEAIEKIDSESDDYEMAKCFRKHGGKITEASNEGLLTIETKKGSFLIEETNTKKHQSH